jgi:hypothetical protein
MKVLEFIKNNAVWHDEMKYDNTRMAFDMASSKNTDIGIYFIVHGKDVLKVGKADGKKGIAGRIQDYRSSCKARINRDNTARLMYDTMTSKKWQGKALEFYTYSVPEVEMHIHGYRIKLSGARSLEEQLSRQAEKEGHSLALSAQH